MSEWEPVSDYVWKFQDKAVRLMVFPQNAKESSPGEWWLHFEGFFMVRKTLVGLEDAKAHCMKLAKQALRAAADSLP